MSQSPLTDLLVDEQALHDEMLHTILKPLVQLTHGGGLIFTSAALAMPVKTRALVGILAGTALYRLGSRPQAILKPKELESLTGIAGGTLRPALRELVKLRLVRSQGGGYEVPSYALEGVRKALQS